MRLKRGDIVEAEDDEGVFVAVIAQTELLARSTVIVCLVTPDPIEIALPVRMPLREPVPGVAAQSQVLADKAITIPRDYIKRVLRRMTFDELHELESALILVLGLAPRIVFYPFV